jgi:hypothetical protein
MQAKLTATGYSQQHKRRSYPKTRADFLRLPARWDPPVNVTCFDRRHREPIMTADIPFAQEKAHDILGRLATPARSEATLFARNAIQSS